MVNLASQSHFFVRAAIGLAIGRAMGLAISEAVSIGIDVTIGFSRLSL